WSWRWRPRSMAGTASSSGTICCITISAGTSPIRWRWLVEGASQEEIETAFAGWEMLASEPADTAGLGWPITKTAPPWYRLGRPN
ncbi:MAG TPA: hypothetical protein VHS32_33050, partial [Streptosporangiaceae bacterium]|nr:hypothetical protein [Streptosporangiaceae bacterium]